MISTHDQLLDATGNNSQQLVVSKASLSSQVAGQPCSLWRSAGLPAQGAIPTAATVCTGSTTGAFILSNPPSGQTRYMARAMLISSVTATDVQFHDRLIAMGGLVGNSIASQLSPISIMASELMARRGASDLSYVQWWLEWYTATGSTSTTINVNVTYDDDSTGVCPVTTSGTMGASRMLQIIPAVAGRRIKAVNSVQLTVSTGTAGNFGITATRAITGIALGLANSGVVADSQYLGFPSIPDDAAIAMVVFPGGTSTGTLYGSGKIVAG